MAMTLVLKVGLLRIIAKQVFYIYTDDTSLQIHPKVIIACNALPVNCYGKSNIAIQYCCFYSMNA